MKVKSPAALQNDNQKRKNVAIYFLFHTKKINKNKKNLRTPTSLGNSPKKVKVEKEI